MAQPRPSYLRAAGKEDSNVSSLSRLDSETATPQQVWSPANGTRITVIRLKWTCPISRLIALWTGRKPTLRTYEMICFYFCGLASEDELLSHIAKLKQQDEARPDQR